MTLLSLAVEEKEVTNFCADKEGKFADPKDKTCQSFYVCNGGQSSFTLSYNKKGSCWGQMVFDEQKQICSSTYKCNKKRKQ